VNADQALELMKHLLEVTMLVAGPVLGASLLAGVLIGIIQAATQINEASISFVGKVMAVVAVGLLVGPALAAQVVSYTKSSISSIEHVVRG
jgi:flagellar biosynthetic protein FliQ